MHHSSQGMYKKNILSKSLNTEVLKTSSSILMILFLLVVGSRFVGYFEKAAEGLMDPSLIFSVIFLRFPDFITLLIPLSFFLGILISISRLYAEREIYGYISVGLSQLDLVKFLAPQAFIYFFITLILSLYVAPYTKALSQEIMSIDSFEEQIESMKPDKIYSFEDGRVFIYAKAINDGVLEDVKIFRTDDNGSNLIMAEQLRVNKDNRQLELDFKSGVFYKGIFSDQRQVISSFEKFISPVDRDIDRVSGLSMAKIFDYSAESEKANLQWNISIPATLIILLFLGVYMGAVKPRQGRLSVILPGMLIYIAYLSLLILGRESLSSNPSSGIGLWWIHLVFGLLAILYIFKDNLQIANSRILIIREHQYFKYIIGTALLFIFIWVIS
ncbi:LptF/LptG family permease [Gammaproteobacteria bacterium]|nr:LptF/LptG family permease [Gammaproteobacteria bacterium]MDA7800143.1 LptF/LptG family permease [Gammaproteobacteria bacterium]MDA8899333.1 LptF/LptG family permease [Gammaproteobacteria bacterium]MDA8999366.1 LptF/LptG family permease [Gammaproteobacteria bacterium]MDA9053947.1 LptF/LptG family permease [Gammaproteobacteria bacterium]